jgi:hypothetical protein
MACMFRAMLHMATLFTCATLSLRAQVTILNNGVAVPEKDVNLLFRTSCRVMTEEFHLDSACGVDFPVTLVLGDQNERVSGDELKQEYFIYMNQWNEAQFATSASRLILQHMVSRDRKTRIVAEILRRVNRMAPVSRQGLQDQTASRR